MKQILIIYPLSNRHIGLWKDLETDERVFLRGSGRRQLNRFYSFLLRCLFHFKIKFIQTKFNYKRFEYHDLFKLIRKVNYLLIIDGTLNQLNISDLEKCRKLNPKLEISLYLINSINAHSLVMRNVKPKINLFRWNNVYTFDPEDAKQFGYKYLGFNYYSKPVGRLDVTEMNNVYFVGGLKGGRDELVYSVYKYLKTNGIKTMYDINVMDSKVEKIVDSNINYFNTWIPYSYVINKILKSKCILEIMQQGQYGATLRYFEAVTMNKKLLTNNPNIVNFPFYNPKWMKIFNVLEDIDLNWLASDENVDYQYNNEFSPAHLVDYIITQK